MDTESTTVYKCGSLVDLCVGPHIRHTGLVKALKIMSNSRSYWFGDVNREALQRVYGVSFPSQKLLKEHLDRLEKAKKSNHMLVGKVILSRGTDIIVYIIQSLWFQKICKKIFLFLMCFCSRNFLAAFFFQDNHLNISIKANFNTKLKAKKFNFFILLSLILNYAKFR